MHTFIKYAVVATSVAMVLAPSLALAVLPQPTVPVGNPTQAVTAGTVERLINQAAQFLITVSLVVAVIFIIWGGVQALRGGWGAAKGTLTNAAWGVGIILGVGLIMQTIARFVQTQSLF